MAFAKILFENISLLLALAYMFNLGYKYIFQHAPWRVKYGLTVAVFIVAGWLSMVYGMQIRGGDSIDLSFLPLIVAVLVFPHAATIAAIGAGIGLGRFFFDWNLYGWLGFINLVIVGLAGGAANIWLKRLSWRFVWKSFVAVVGLNTLFAVNTTIAHVIGKSMTALTYWEQIGSLAFPMRVVLSTVFILIIRDFQKEQLRVDELRTMNMLLRRQTRELREAKREVEEKARQLLLASKYKSEFLANMSHELKTPLNSILLLSQLIRDNDDGRYEPDEVSYAGLIHAAGNDLLQLINDILDMSKVEAGKMDIHFETVSLHDFVHMLHQQFLPMAEQKRLLFECEIAPNVPDTFISDELRLNQILRNLLVNAFKFTEKGSVKLIVRPEMGTAAAETGGQGIRLIRMWNSVSWGVPGPVKRPIAVQRISFTVADTGIGIDPEKQQMIFEAFQQEDGAINRKYGGTGLGLSISLQLARLLGGTLALKSEKGQGSSFTLHVPLKPDAGTVAGAAAGGTESVTGYQQN